MDGLSGAASVVAILQLCESVVKLIDFAKSVRNAPANVKALFNDLELLAGVLEQAKNAVSKVKLDDATVLVLKDCQHKILVFENKIRSASSHLNSESYRRRTWSALKITLQSKDIASVRQSVSEAKINLNLVLQSSILNVTSSIFDRQERSLEQLQHCLQSVNILSITNVSEKHTMQLPALENPETAFVPDVHEHHTIPVASQAVEKKTLTLSYQTEFQDDLPRISNRRPPIVLMSRGKGVTTPMGRVLTQRTTWQAPEDEGRQERVVQVESKSIIYPSRAAQFLGISYGLLVTARSTVGWKYTIEPFRAVPETALIFEFCRSGNVDAVRLLLQRGDASPLDRDPTGRTPLWVAANSLRLDVAELLLDAGADTHAADWKTRSEPIASVAQSQGIKMKPKLAMIDLLLKRRRDEYEDMSLLFMLGVFFRKYRVQTRIEMSWDEKRLEVLSAVRSILRTIPLGAEGDINRTNVLDACITFFFDGDILRYILSGIRGFIDQSSQIGSILHDAISQRLLERDPESMVIIMQKTRHFHMLTNNGRINEPPRTPTMLTMYDSRLFVAWRDILRRHLHYDVGNFVHDELEQGTLRAAGWNQFSLTYLLEADLTGSAHYGRQVFGFPVCERCGRGLAVGTPLTVDLRWRRYLRSVRRQFSRLSVSNEQELDHSRMEVCQITARNDSFATTSKHLPYRMVCSTDCEDGVCVAWLYEDDSHMEPSFPPYPQQATATSTEIVETCLSTSAEDDISSYMKIPGAFVE